MAFQEREREIAMYNEETQEWREAQMGYGELRGDSERRIISAVGFWGLREKLNDFGGCRGQ